MAREPKDALGHASPAGVRTGAGPWRFLAEPFARQEPRAARIAQLSSHTYKYTHTEEPAGGTARARAPVATVTVWLVFGEVCTVTVDSGILHRHFSFNVVSLLLSVVHSCDITSSPERVLTTYFSLTTLTTSPMRNVPHVCK